MECTSLAVTDFELSYLELHYLHGNTHDNFYVIIFFSVLVNFMAHYPNINNYMEYLQGNFYTIAIEQSCKAQISVFTYNRV